MVLIGEITEDVLHNVALKVSRSSVHPRAKVTAITKHKNFPGRGELIRHLPVQAQVLRFEQKRVLQNKDFAKQRR